MNALFGVPDVKEMQWYSAKLLSVQNLQPCAYNDVVCRFHANGRGQCERYCIEDHIWIRESQIPEYLAARLVEGAV